MTNIYAGIILVGVTVFVAILIAACFSSYQYPEDGDR